MLIFAVYNTDGVTHLILHNSVGRFRTVLQHRSADEEVQCHAYNSAIWCRLGAIRLHRS